MATQDDVIDQRLILLRRHWRPSDRIPTHVDALRDEPLKLTIAISREAGAPGSEVAEHLSKRLDWPVYDREILDMISQQSGLRTELLATMDEHDPYWLQEAITSFGYPGELSSAGYVRILRRVLATLAAHGNCIVVGRGATAQLPPTTTLRIRIVEPLEIRAKRIAKQCHLSERDAEKRAQKIDLERLQFIVNHFRVSIDDPHNFDLTLNTAFIRPSQCADLIVPLVKMRQQASLSMKSEVM
jgi:cytidylate kinase